MSSSEDDDLNAIAWPGFVDILSSVIIMFVFFLLAIASALYFHMVIFVSKVRSDEVAEEVLQESEFEFKQENSEFAESKEQSVEINTEEKEIVIFFGQDAISILPETSQQVLDFLNNYSPDEYRLLITAPRPKQSTNITKRKIAIARMFNLRNTTLDAGFAHEDAIPKLVDALEINDDVEWARIQVIKK